ncbi:SDR family oxidoreductase [Amycolatopsis thermoflava]|uniref:SDR family oxidoreductase n=1 Tax=Amycolatopsis thermoflava TaxID=84480 RepID=UPI0036601B3F
MNGSTTSTGAPRRLVVTGAASGIGQALATRLAGAGHDVIGVDRVTDGVPAGAQALRCDITDAEAVAATLDRISSAGPIDGLAAVAGVPGTAPASTVYAVNIVGLRRLTEALVPLVRRGGALVLLSSMAGYRGAATDDEADELLALPDREFGDRLAAAKLDGPEAYQLSKRLVHRYATLLAARLHPAGVRCLSVSPGPVRTPILADFRATMPSLDLAGELVGRHADPGEIAAIVEFALSPDASWLNGVDLRADGGLGALRVIQKSDSLIAN